jgi:signal transduction histidine kinase
MAVEMLPAFWQTWWFRLLGALTFLLGVFVLYRLRLRRLTTQLNLRFEERLTERTRIARDLHDTLLQGLLSASMQLHVAVDGIPSDLPAKPQLRRVLQLMQQVVDEGRNAVRGLRASGGSINDLEVAFSGMREEHFIPESTEFRVIIEGRTCNLNPFVRDEVYRIGREALVNAFRHSGATSVEIEIDYAPRRLHLVVRDNGSGIQREVLRSGREGHWGLVGMRERAERIGGRLKVWSRAAAGTEVELTVPGHIAFPPQDSSESRKWHSRWWPGKADVEVQASLKGHDHE